MECQIFTSVSDCSYMYDSPGWMDGDFCPRPPHPLTATSAPFLAGGLSESWGCWAPHTVNFLRQLHRLPEGTPELYRHSSTAPRLKSAVWSTVITSRVLHLTRGGGGGSYAMGGTDSRAETLSTMFQTHVSLISVWDPFQSGWRRLSKDSRQHSAAHMFFLEAPASPLLFRRRAKWVWLYINVIKSLWFQSYFSLLSSCAPKTKVTQHQSPCFLASNC